MGLKSFLDDIIPNELKGNLGKIAAIAGASYFGYKGLTSDTMKGFIGKPSMLNMPFDQKSSATGLYKFAETFDKYKDNPLIKFGKGMIGTTVGKGGAADEKAANDMYLQQMRALDARYTSNKFSGSPIGAGNFQAAQVASPGFTNSRVQQSLGNMAQYMADLQDNGRIDSSALYAEGPKGTTIKVGGSSLSSLKQV
tara:strand:- start:4715 stop:5302 length:588 start_codon:yes stop_codon:yes gene_type:complete